MYKLVIFAAVLALAVAAPAGPPAVLTYTSPVAIAHAPIAYAAPAVIPAPITYHTGYQVAYEVEPVEQHGYSIKY